MTQITRLFPNQPEPIGTPDAAPDAGWGVARPDLRPRAQPAVVPFPAPGPPAPPAGGATAGELHSPLRLARLIATLETAPGIPDHIRAMPGMDVLRHHFEMQSALNGLLRGLIKE